MRAILVVGRMEHTTLPNTVKYHSLFAIARAACPTASQFIHWFEGNGSVH